ncbi:MAG: hydroxyphenylacetyl-CoA thioesterase PaaI [Gammaproteobacteria bacterium]|nr:hydroxyphenylacetyl-CoA thioesterase PaaI [Gammaproteobacteria bacterium]
MSHPHKDPQVLAEQSAAAMLATDRVGPLLGMRLVKIAPDTCTLAMTVRADMGNGHGICHGGMIFTLADSAFAFACNTGGGSAVAATGSIDFLAPAHVDDELTAVATTIWRRGRTAIQETVVSNQKGEIIALHRGRSQLVSATRPPPGTKP